MNKNNTIVIDEKTPLLVLAGPMFLELLLNTMLNNVDMLMLSHYDEYAVGAVGNANIILFMMNILFSIIAMATSVVAAQYLGAKLYKKMNITSLFSSIPWEAPCKNDKDWTAVSGRKPYLQSLPDYASFFCKYDGK